MPIVRFRRTDLPNQPWKNGLGTTKELVTWPRGAGMDDFVWRVSIAHITKDCSFSSFPGIDRVITLLSGAGVVLQSRDRMLHHVLDEPLHPFAFSGDTALHATLIKGDCFDFNLMTLASACTGRVDMVQAKDKSFNLKAQHGLVMACTGRWRCSDQEFHPDEGFGWHQSLPISHDMIVASSADASALVVQVQPHAAAPLSLEQIAAI
jgi:uncharacterized protein